MAIFGLAAGLRWQVGVELGLGLIYSVKKSFLHLIAVEKLVTHLQLAQLDVFLLAHRQSSV